MASNTTHKSNILVQRPFKFTPIEFPQLLINKRKTVKVFRVYSDYSFDVLVNFKILIDNKVETDNYIINCRLYNHLYHQTISYSSLKWFVSRMFEKEDNVIEFLDFSNRKYYVDVILEEENIKLSEYINLYTICEKLGYEKVGY